MELARSSLEFDEEACMQLQSNTNYSSPGPRRIMYNNNIWNNVCIPTYKYIYMGNNIYIHIHISNFIVRITKYMTKRKNIHDHT